jgi:predicted ArsR family transcriptional regulator
MRYRETGEVHLDFHRTTNGTIAYLRERYGRAVLDETFRRTAQEVYRAIHDDLKRGDPEHLVEHVTYYMAREGGACRVEREEGVIRLIVERCPAIAYLQRKGHAIDPEFCRQTVVMNEAWSEGTPFLITTEVLGDGKCVQTIRRRP